jgi:hypothetical protein
MALDGAENRCNMTSSDSKVEKIQMHFQALSSVASSLNTASDELTKVVGVLDEALKKLNVGLTVWVTFIKWTGEACEYDEEQIGYCKVNGKWGIALRRIWGDEVADNHVEDGPWLFSDGPREMRLRGVDKIPEVIEELGKAASDTTKRIHETTEEVRELASAIEKIANPEKVVAPPPLPALSSAARQVVAPPPPPPAPPSAKVQPPPAPPAPPSLSTLVGKGKEGVK